jgi:hypothetical protein
VPRRRVTTFEQIHGYALVTPARGSACASTSAVTFAM